MPTSSMAASGLRFPMSLIVFYDALTVHFQVRSGACLHVLAVVLVHIRPAVDKAQRRKPLAFQIKPRHKDLGLFPDAKLQTTDG